MPILRLKIKAAKSQKRRQIVIEKIYNCSFSAENLAQTSDPWLKWKSVAIILHPSARSTFDWLPFIHCITSMKRSALFGLVVVLCFVSGSLGQEFQSKQDLDWSPVTTLVKSSSDPGKEVNCSTITTCKECQQNGCGWCSFGGFCAEGNETSPPASCYSTYWFFNNPCIGLYILCSRKTKKYPWFNAPNFVPSCQIAIPSQTVQSAWIITCFVAGAERSSNVLILNGSGKVFGILHIPVPAKHGQFTDQLSARVSTKSIHIRHIFHWFRRYTKAVITTRTVHHAPTHKTQLLVSWCSTSHRLMRANLHFLNIYIFKLEKCGWCYEEGICAEGNQTGAFAKQCGRWQYQSRCPSNQS